MPVCATTLPVNILKTAFLLSILREWLLGPVKSRKNAIKLNTMPIKQRAMMERITCTTRGVTQSINTEIEEQV